MFLTRKRKSKFFKFLNFTKLPALPFILNVEPGNICNLKCPLCPTGSGAPGMTKGFIDLALFKHIFNQLNGVLTSVNLFSWGEPLLNKELVNIIKHIKESDKLIHVTISTNLNIRDDKLLADLTDSGIDEIIVSCDGATKESYGKYRVGGDFDLVMHNLKLLIKKKQELNTKTDIIWNFIVFKHNEGEIVKARQIAESMGASFRIGLMRISMKDEILKPHKEAISKDKDWIPDNSGYSAYDKERCLPKKILKTCRKPWQEISVNWDGKVFPCCAIFGEEYNVGDARKESITKIWNNSKFVAARKEILHKGRAANTICGICRDNGFMHM